MFRNRQSSQKPPDELFERFRQSFPGVRTTADGSNAQTALADGVHGSSLSQPRFDHGHEDLDPTPRAPAESFRFTPSLLDPTSSAFAAFANQQPPGLFTPTPGGTNPLLNANPVTTQHGLETPNIGISIDTPLSLPTHATMAPPTAEFAAPQTIQPHQFHNYQPFTQSMHTQYLDPSQYDPRPPSGPGSPMDVTGGGELVHEPDPLASSLVLGGGPLLQPLDGKQFDQINSDMQLLPSAERFRFHVVLNAPTAMIKHPDEIPVTYLNKGQAYAISMVDTQPPSPSTTPVRYRTFIRISFHDGEQRKEPGRSWQLWKEGRGTSEAHQRGGKLQAVEFVENPSNGEEERKRARVDLESASFDGFSVIWSPPTAGIAEASVSVRFNFLSTDFSHSKGVKGIPVRLCAKSEVLSTGSPRSPPNETEIAYCKVKLFRDHGAERKLANDKQHVQKNIEKLKQQASQLEGTGMKVFGKKNKKDEDLSKPGKVPKHKRTWSMSSASSVGGGRSQEDDTAIKLQSLDAMFTSTKPVSLFYLRGDEQDDPDLHPVYLAGEHRDHPDGDDVWARRRLSVATTNTTASSFVSPTPSSASLNSQRENFSSPEKDWENRGYSGMNQSGAAEVPVRVKTSNDAGMLSGWIEAIGIDSSYAPPAEKPVKAKMCIYILPILPDQNSNDAYHRAVYLKSRTASCLSSSIASKCGLDPTTIFRLVHVNPRGLSIIIDDDFVNQMNEGQDMKVQAVEMHEQSPFASPPREWSGSDILSDGEDSKSNITHGWELRLIY